MSYRLLKRTFTRNGKTTLSTKWYWEYKLPEETSYTRRCTGYTDKRVAEEYCRNTFREMEQEKLGIIPSREIRDGMKKSIEEHLHDFIVDRESVGRNYRALSELKNRVLVLVKECGWKCIKDISADDFVKWRRKQKLKPKTLNNYYDSLTVLCNWLERKGKIPHHPFKGVDKVPVLEQNHRLAFTPEEINRLLQVAGKRKALYLVALTTGLRAGELQQMEWGDVHLNDPLPHLRVRASTTKNKKEALQNLVEPALSELQKLYSPSFNPSQKIFAHLMKREGFFKYDLEAAGLLLSKEERGMRDFHSLRATFITWGQAAGVSQRVMMDLARHSDRKLTDRIYTDTRLLPTSEALQKINFAGLLGQEKLEKSTKISTEICTESTEKGTRTSFPQSLQQSQAGTGFTDLEKWQVLEKEHFSRDESQFVTVNPENKEWLRGQDLNL